MPNRSPWVGLAVSLFLFGTGFSARAQSEAPTPPRWQENGPEVDVALVLAVDISYSMDLDELTLQRDGYITALTSPKVIDAVRKGMIGKIAVTYIEWAGTYTRHVIADWGIIEDETSAKAFVAQIAAAPTRRARRTSITTALDFSMDQLQAAKLRPLRRVIDISGDGPNNEGGPVTDARERALRAGVIINGLPIILERGNRSSFDISGLDAYYQDCVIGGPGSFMITITDRAQFADAIRTKILREVAQSSANDVTAPSRSGRADCLIGEKLWRQSWERN